MDNIISMHMLNEDYQMIIISTFQISNLIYSTSLLNTTALRSKSKNWLSWNLENVSEWSDMSTHTLLVVP